MIISLYRAASRVASQGLHVGRLFQVMPVVVAQEDLVVLADAVVEASRCQVLPRVKWKHSAVILKLAYDEAIHQLLLLRKDIEKRADPQLALEYLGARVRLDGRLRRT